MPEFSFRNLRGRREHYGRSIKAEGTYSCGINAQVTDSHELTVQGTEIEAPVGIYTSGTEALENYFIYINGKFSPEYSQVDSSGPSLGTVILDGVQVTADKYGVESANEVKIPVTAPSPAERPDFIIQAECLYLAFLGMTQTLDSMKLSRYCRIMDVPAVQPLFQRAAYPAANLRFTVQARNTMTIRSMPPEIRLSSTLRITRKCWRL